MSRKPRMQVVTMKCRRGCGRNVATTNRSIHGFDEMHRKYHGVCRHCITKEENQEMNDKMFSPEGAMTVINSAR